MTQTAPLGLIPSAAIPAENSRLRLDTLALCVRLHKGDGDALKMPFLGMRSAVISSHSGGRQRTPSSPRLPMAVAEQHLEAAARGSQLGAAGGWQRKGVPVRACKTMGLEDREQFSQRHEGFGDEGREWGHERRLILFWSRNLPSMLTLIVIRRSHPSC